MNSSPNATLLEAFDHAGRECARIAAGSGAGATSAQLLASTLAQMRAASVDGDPPTAEALGAVVRSAAIWTGDEHIGLLAALGAVVRALPRND